MLQCCRLSMQILIIALIERLFSNRLVPITLDFFFGTFSRRYIYQYFNYSTWNWMFRSFFKETVWLKTIWFNLVIICLYSNYWTFCILIILKLKTLFKINLIKLKEKIVSHNINKIVVSRLIWNPHQYKCQSETKANIYILSRLRINHLK